MTRRRTLRRCLCAAFLLLPACSQFTSIDRDANGDYVITGMDGGSGFVWICSYDAATTTLTVKRKEPR
jgi:hypothetical protein